MLSDIALYTLNKSFQIIIVIKTENQTKLQYLTHHSMFLYDYLFYVQFFMIDERYINTLVHQGATCKNKKNAHSTLMHYEVDIFIHFMIH